MKKLSPNPNLAKYHSTFSTESYHELIITIERRISALITSIQQAEQYLTTNPLSKPVIYRLSNMRKDLERAYIDRDKAECRLVVLLERIAASDKP